MPSTFLCASFILWIPRFGIFIITLGYGTLQPCLDGFLSLVLHPQVSLPLGPISGNSAVLSVFQLVGGFLSNIFGFDFLIFSFFTNFSSSLLSLLCLWSSCLFCWPFSSHRSFSLQKLVLVSSCLLSHSFFLATFGNLPWHFTYFRIFAFRRWNQIFWRATVSCVLVPVSTDVIKYPLRSTFFKDRFALAQGWRDGKSWQWEREVASWSHCIHCQKEVNAGGPYMDFKL